MSIKYLTIFSTRPQWIKILDNLENHVICNTGQHYDFNMDGAFGKFLKIKPKYNLEARKLGEMIDRSIKVIKNENPDFVIVMGDTKSTLAGALAAKSTNTKLIHVESGLRSGEMSQPEEWIRVTVDRLADIRFCPNFQARENLQKEGILDGVFVVGDPMWDSLSKVLPVAKTKDSGQYNLLTVHRAENQNQNALKAIFSAIEMSGERVKFPLHPHTEKTIKQYRLKIPKNIEVLPPQDWKNMVKLESNAKKVLTDSGGVLRESYWFGKMCIILRWVTEWPEVLETGWGTLVGTDRNLILKALQLKAPSQLKSPPRLPEWGCKERIKQILNG